MSLHVKCYHHHFASSVETTTFKVTPPKGKKIEELTLKITDRHNVLVYGAEWSAGNLPADCKCQWNGENTEAPPVQDSRGAAIKQYVNPLGSPYTAKFEAKLAPAKPAKKPPSGISSSSTGSTETCPSPANSSPPDEAKETQEGSAEVRVLYREIKLEPVEWEEVYKAVSGQSDKSFPTAGTDDTKKLWLQYKLNELGYVAGPLKNPPDENPLLRSLFRYTQAYPDAALMPKIYDFQTRAAGAAGACGWGWKAAWEAKYGTLAELCQGPTKQPAIDLLDKLKAGDRPRNDLFKESKNLTEKRLLTRIILDHDIFYINGENTDPDGHTDYDKEFLNPFCWPMKVKILLVSKADADAQKPGKDAPKAIGPARCEWFLFDPPENMTIVPKPVEDDVPARLKSKTRYYLGQLQQNRAGRYHDKANAWDNCPDDLGGVRPAMAGNVSGNFFAVPNAGTTTSSDGSRFLSSANTDAANPQGQLGRTCVFFQGSYIAGDNYVVQARLSWEGIPDGDALKAEHQKLSGLARSFGPIKSLGMDENEPMAAQTLRMTIWRRHHVLREITWADALFPAANWEPIVRNFDAAHILLIPPTEPPIHAENLFPGAAQRTALTQALIDGFRATGPDTNKAAPELGRTANKPPVFNRGGLFPVNMPDFNTISPPGPAPEARFDAYANYLAALRNEWPTYTFLRPFFQAVREEFDKLGKGPGLVVLRAALLPSPDTGVPPNVSAALPQPRTPFKYGYRALSAGGDHGVVLLDDCAIEKFDETFFVSHEIGHCLFLTHPFQHAGDHDADDNCLMTYNLATNGNGGEPLGWAVSKKNLPTQFYVRVDLAANKFGIPSYGIVSSDFIQDDPKTYHFEGDLAKCQKAISGFKFTPDKKLEADTVVTLKLGPEQNKLPPWLSVALPHKVDVGVRAGAQKPFAGITAKKPDPEAFHPFFCGKCVLKVRGWRVRENAAHSGPANAPAKSRAVPINGRMQFTGYKVGEGEAVFWTGPSEYFQVNFGLDAKDPDNRRAVLGPYRFLHEHKFTWESSTGQLQDLAGVMTREVVRWNGPTQGTPFNNCADPDQQFAQVGGEGSDGKGTDDHSMRCPGLICQRDADGTPIAGIITAQQSYQYCLVPNTYSKDPADWIDISNSQFLLEKSVYYDKKHKWVLKFTKTNNPDKNPVEFHFEVCYKIGPAPAFTSRITFTGNQFAGASGGAPVFGYASDGQTIKQEVWAAGDETMDAATQEPFSLGVAGKHQQAMRLNALNLSPKITDAAVTLKELIKKGLAISGTT